MGTGPKLGVIPPMGPYAAYPRPPVCSGPPGSATWTECSAWPEGMGLCWQAHPWTQAVGADSTGLWGILSLYIHKVKANEGYVGEGKTI